MLVFYVCAACTEAGFYCLIVAISLYCGVLDPVNEGLLYQMHNIRNRHEGGLIWQCMHVKNRRLVSFWYVNLIAE